jgi:hypothetical protein
MEGRRHARTQQRQGKGQRHALMLEMTFTHLLRMGQKQAAEHGKPCIATHHSRTSRRACARFRLPEY